MKKYFDKITGKIPNFKRIIPISFVKQIISIIIVLLVLYFFGRQIFFSYNDLKNFNWDINYGYLIIAFLFFLIYFAFSIFQYYMTLKEMKQKVSLKAVAKARSLSDIASYVPGKVLLIITRIKYLKHKISTLKVIASTIFELLLVIFSASLLFFLGLILFDGVSLGFYSYIVYTFVTLCFIIIHPRILSFFVNIFLKSMGKPIIKTNIKYSDILSLTTVYIISWISIGIAVFFVVNSIFPLSFKMIPAIIISYAIAWLIGYFAFFVPSGLGIREGVLSYTLAFIMPPHIAIIVAIISRILYMVAQFIFAAVFYF